MLEHYFSQNGLTACYTDTAITLFWDKPAAAGAVETYTILRNDTVADTTTKTHFTLEHLLPETEYTLFVQWRGGGIGELTRPHYAHETLAGCGRCALQCSG